MKKNLLQKAFIFLLLITMSTSFGQERQKLAQTGMKFLSVSVDARSAAMADAVTSIFSNSAAMLYNPSTMAYNENLFDVSIGRTNWIADINYLHGTATYRPGNGEYGIFGISYEAVDYGELLGTIVYPNDQGYLDVGTFKPSALAVGLGYAKALSQKFSIGANIRYVRQSLGTSTVDVTSDNGNLSYVNEENKVDAFSVDFGILYKTGFKSLAFGMSIRNFSTEIKYKVESFQLPLTFKMGLSMNALDLLEIDPKEHSLLVSVDASHPRDYYEQVGVGLEYTFMNLVSLRAGYITPSDEHAFSYGVGVQKEFADMWFKLDYAFTPFDVFNDVHRFSFYFLF